MSSKQKRAMVKHLSCLQYHADTHMLLAALSGEVSRCPAMLKGHCPDAWAHCKCRCGQLPEPLSSIH